MSRNKHFVSYGVAFVAFTCLGSYFLANMMQGTKFSPEYHAKGEIDAVRMKTRKEFDLDKEYQKIMTQVGDISTYELKPVPRPKSN